MSGSLKTAWVPVIELRDPKGKSVSRFYLVNDRGETSMDCSRALATRERAKAEAILAGHPCGRVLEWALSDERINA